MRCVCVCAPSKLGVFVVVEKRLRSDMNETVSGVARSFDESQVRRLIHNFGHRIGEHQASRGEEWEQMLVNNEPTEVVLPTKKMRCLRGGAHFLDQRKGRCVVQKNDDGAFELVGKIVKHLPDEYEPFPHHAPRCYLCFGGAVANHFDETDRPVQWAIEKHDDKSTN